MVTLSTLRTRQQTSLRPQPKAAAAQTHVLYMRELILHREQHHGGVHGRVVVIIVILLCSFPRQGGLRRHGTCGNDAGLSSG